MVMPFKEIRSFAKDKGLIQIVMNKLDVPIKNRRAAEIEINNLLCSAKSISSINKDDVDRIMFINKVNEDERKVLVERILSRIINHMMKDDILTEGERNDLKTIVKTFSIEGSYAKQVLKSVGLQIYYDRYKQAKADGEVTEQEADKLNYIKRIFNLDVVGVSKGIDKTAYIASKNNNYIQKLNEYNKTLDGLLVCLDKAEDVNQDIVDIREYGDFRDRIEELCIEIDNYINEIEDMNKNDMDSVSLLYELLDELLVRCNNLSADGQINKVKDWIKMSSKEIENLQKKEFERKKKTNSKIAKNAGFEPAGSPKQKSWAYDIIVEQCMVDNKYNWLLAVASDVNGEKSESAVRALNWLKTRPAGWWINTFQESDIEKQVGHCFT